MTQNQFRLLGSRRFAPLFVTQFLGAFNDNVFKNSLVLLILYVIATGDGDNGQVLVVAAAGIFIVPFFVFSATAGKLADKFDKARLIRLIKLCEIALMALAALAFSVHSVELLMLVLFLMGTQSAFFGPLKYGILPDHLAEDELIGANALISGATFIAILLGTVVGGLMILDDGALRDGGIASIIAIVIAVAVAGWAVSLLIPSTSAANPELAVSPNVVAETLRMVRYAAGHRDVFLSILAISWFWLVGATILAQLPVFAKDVVGGNEQVYTLFLTLFSVGIGLGALLCNRLLKGEVHATFVPLGAVALSVFSFDLFFASARVVNPGTGEFMGAMQFLSVPSNWRLVVDLLLVAVSGGLYVVPLNTMIQVRSEPEHRARNIATNNIMNSLFMVVASLGTAAMLTLEFTVPEIILTIAVLNLGVAVYICRLLPGALAKGVLAWLLHTCYRVRVEGLKNFEKAGDKVLIVANHQSFLDAALIAAFVPDRLTFAVNTFIARQRIIRFFLSLAETFPVDPANPLATRALIGCVNDLKKVVIFPEGRITVTGSLMKVYEGPGMIADKSGAMILPVRIEGAQYSIFSRLKGKVRTRLFPTITVRFMEPRRFELPADLKGRRRRQLAGRRLYEVMTEMIFESSDYRRGLFASLLDALDTHGGGHVVLEDVERRPMTYGRFVTSCFVLGRLMAGATEARERVGLLLPNTIAAAVSFFGLHAFGRVPAMLNFSTGIRNVASACTTARIRRVYTSRRFVEMAKLGPMVDALQAEGVRVVALEDLRDGIGIGAKLAGFASARAARLVHWMSAGRVDADDEAVVLFTSGTEGAPKGVVLSHANLQANRYQVASCIDFGPSDIVFNALPMFHSFGLTCGTILPLLSGLKVFLYPSPLHYRIVPQLAYDANATIMFGTDTFLAGYARFAHPYDFYSMRYVFTGAEKLKEETRRAYSEKYGVRVFEGYGATETAPALTMNTPMRSKPGSVGRLFPGIEHRLEPVPGIEEGGRLLVRGPNVMKGYLRADNPGVLEPPEDGWYDTGDIVAIDEEGFVTIKGRAKRFAKIGGEMVSLASVEQIAAELWPGHMSAVVAVPDARKGEQLVLVSDNPQATREALQEYAREQGVGEIAVPRKVVTAKAIPLLGSGKTDYKGVEALVEALVEAVA
jgi:acyl-[acyl-carrier-protein]-phospholipid O-acyltransferase/long-chain-fatty-acid--[acyl-carrier-protein] ligase